MCSRWVAGRVGSGSDLEVALAQGEGVWEVTVLAASQLLLPSLGHWERTGGSAKPGKGSKALPGQGLDSMPTAGSSRAGPQPGSFLSPRSHRWLHWLHWGMERLIWGQE